MLPPFSATRWKKINRGRVNREHIHKYIEKLLRIMFIYINQQTILSLQYKINIKKSINFL